MILTLRTDLASLAACTIAVALSIAVVVIIDAYWHPGTGFRKALAFVPFMVLSILIALNNSRQMSVGWNSFLVSSGVSRGEAIGSIYTPAITACTLTAIVTALLSAIVFPGEGEILGCVCLSLLLSSISLMMSLIHFSDSVSSLASDILGAVMPIALLIALYMMSEGAFPIDVFGSVSCILVATILLLSGWMVSTRLFRRRDI